MSWEAGDALQGTGLAGEMVARLKASIKRFDAKHWIGSINAEAAAIAAYANSIEPGSTNVNAAWDVSERFVGDGDSTTFTLLYGGMSARDEDHEVYRNGVLMESGQDADYQIGRATGPSGRDQVVFTHAPRDGAKVRVKYMRGGRRWACVDKFVGDGETSAFVLSWSDIETDERSHTVTKNGMLMEHGPGNDYTFVVTLENTVAVVFVEPPRSGSKIAVRYMRSV